MKDARHVQRTRTRSIGSGGQILEITLSRPNKANAYDEQMLDELSAHLSAVHVGGPHKAIILRSCGDRAFCAGADRHELDARQPENAFHLKSRDVFEQLAHLPVCSVAMIDGAAIGGGFELALACDARVCSGRASFHLPELTFALSPAAGGARRLMKLVGRARASQVCLFGKKLNAEEAHAWGLVAYQGDAWEAKGIELAKFAADQDSIAWALNKAALCDNARLRVALEAATQAILYERRKKG